MEAQQHCDNEHHASDEGGWQKGGRDALLAMAAPMACKKVNPQQIILSEEKVKTRRLGRRRSRSEEAESERGGVSKDGGLETSKG